MPSILNRVLFRLTVLLATCAFCATAPASAKERLALSGLPTILVTDLPKEARETLNLIKKGGPFPYAKDGVVFSNREKILPRQPRGFYREYTVKTPGARNRGALRIVCGVSGANVCYFTRDHYQSFSQIKE